MSLGDDERPEEHLAHLGIEPAEARALEEAGRAWSDFPAAHRVDPQLGPTVVRGRRPGESYVRGGVRVRREGFETIGPGLLRATRRAAEPKGRVGHLMSRVRRVVVGDPLATWQAAHERLTKLKALAVLSSDALSSVAYATEQILFVLVAAGAAAYGYSLPIMGAILALLAIVVISYRQTIRAYPRGGGSYIVASDNLGPLAGLIAGCALMTSYTLTVAVSVASGVDAVLSAAPSASGFRVQLCLFFIVILMLGNLRGIRESGSIFAAPTYLFILGMVGMVVTILVKLAVGDLHHQPPQIGRATQDLTIFLVLRAFASGATALTGVEAISDGVPAFQPPEWRNARRTLEWMGLILGAMFLGITVCTYLLGIVAENPNAPHYQTVISQLAHKAFGSGGAGYLYIAITTTAILVLAGNTAFSDFPRLLFFMARDDYAPHQFGRLGDRLAYSNGILVLGVLACVLVTVFQGNVSRLIPLYAVGVFTAFTMSQAGMVSRWLRLREPGWRRGLPINIVGTATTGLVFLVTGTFKFLEGAWLIVVLVPVLVMGCRSVHRHYQEMRALVATETPLQPEQVRTVSIVPIADLNPLALQSLAMARSFTDNVVAVHVSDDEKDIERLQAKWKLWGDRVPLEIINSPYRSLLPPLLRYIDAMQRSLSGDTLLVVLPEMVATRWWHNLLHNQTALRLKAALLYRPGIVVVNVPYHLRSSRRVRRSSRLGQELDL